MRGIIDKRSMVLFSGDNKTYIKAHSIHDAYALGLKEVKELGTPIENGSGVLTKNLHNVSFTIHPVENEAENIRHFRKRVFCENRNLTNKIQDAELIWYMTGNCSVDVIDQFNKGWMKYSDNGMTVNSNYGSIWVTQVFGIIKKLIFDRYTRQAVIQLYDGDMTNDHDTKDVQCATSIDFKIIPNNAGYDELHMTVTMRSNDCVLGMPIDMFVFASLQELVYNEIAVFHDNLKLGTYTHNTSSLHIYESDFDKMNKGIKMMPAERIKAKEEHNFFPTFCTYTTFWVFNPQHIFSKINKQDVLKYVVNGNYYCSFNYIHSVVDQFIEDNIVNYFSIESVMPVVNKAIDFLQSQNCYTQMFEMDEMERFDYIYSCKKHSGDRIMTNTFIANAILSKDLEDYKMHFDNIKTYTSETFPVMKYDVGLAIMNV